MGTSCTLGDDGKLKPLKVTPKTLPSKLSHAIIVQARKHHRVALELNPNNDTVMAVAARALSILKAREPSADHEAVEPGLLCVMRWPQSRGAARVYAHIFHRGARARILHSDVSSTESERRESTSEVMESQ